MDERNLKPMQIITMDLLEVDDVFTYEVKLKGRVCFEVVDKNHGTIWVKNRISDARSKIENLTKKQVVWLRKI